MPQVESVLVENELPFIEVTFRSQLALPAIKQLAASGNLIVGAGTVRTLKEAQEAVASGAQFIVSPAIVPEVIDFCLANEVLFSRNSYAWGDSASAGVWLTSG